MIRTFEVYAHTSPSGKVYVGWTSRGTRIRWAEHVRAANGRSVLALHRAIRKYGAAAFTHRVLERMTTEAGAQHAERLWVKELNASAPAGYNMTAGGESTHGLAQESRERLAASRRGKAHSAEARARMSAAARGKPKSAETRERMRQAKLGTKRSPETCARISAAKKGQGAGRKLSAETLARRAATWAKKRAS